MNTRNTNNDANTTNDMTNDSSIAHDTSNNTLPHHLGVVGTVARFKPLHKGHAVLLESLCERSSHVYIGIGSSNKYDVRNPFTARESKEMIDLILQPRYNNYSLLEVPDVGNGPKWRELILGKFGTLDHFVIVNDYVADLLKNDYTLIPSVRLIPEEKKFPVTATMVRTAIARGEPWEHFVPESIVTYLNELKEQEDKRQETLVDRFVREFGLATLAQTTQEMLYGKPTERERCQPSATTK